MRGSRFCVFDGGCGGAPWTGIAAFLIWLFRGDQLPVAPRGDFLDVEKVTKDTHRERVFPLKGLSRWAAVATFYLNEPSFATTEVGLRSPFWNPLRLVQCLTLPTDFFAKINLVQNRARFLFGVSWVGFQKGRGKRNPRPFCDSLHTFCSYRKYAHGVTGSETLRKGRIRKTNAKGAALSQCHPPARCKFPRSFAVQQ